MSQNEVELWDWKLAAGDMYLGQSISYPSDQRYRYVNQQTSPARFIHNAVVVRSN